MRKTLLAAVTVVTILPFVVAGFVSQSSAKGAPSKLINRFGPSGAVSVDPRNAVPLSALPANIRAAAIPPSSTGSGGCPNSSATNVRANQECTNQSSPGFFGRSQSQNETSVAVNPTNPNNVLISQNDYREGDGACGVDWSMDGGKHFGSQKVDINFARPILGNGGVRHYWTSSGDTSVAFDSSGEAYVLCQVFDRPFPTTETGKNPGGNGVADDSAFLIFRSADGGASWSFPGNYVVSSTGVLGGSPGPFLDKEYMTIDKSGGVHDGRIYVTWSNYDPTFASDPIMVSYSDDHGVTWTTPADISGFSKALCPINYNGATAGNCNANQFSDPVVAPNGDVYVVFANFNNCYGAFGPPCHGSSNDNHNQMLFVKSSDGINWSSPVKVSDYYELPDCFTYTGQNFGRACVPTNPLSGSSVFRAANYPSIAVMQDGRIVVDFGSYINAHSNPDIKGNCSAAGLSASGGNLYQGVGVAGGCNNDIVRSTSDDGGLTFTGTNTKVENLFTISHESGPVSDQWFQWTTSFQNKAVAMFYDRKYGNDEINGNMDITLVSTNSGLNPNAVGVPIRVTDASMPPSNEFPGTNGFSLFMGDYSGIAVGSDGVAHPAWEDTRNPIFTFDETADARVLTPAGFGGDIYTAAVKIVTST